MTEDDRNAILQAANSIETYARAIQARIAPSLKLAANICDAERIKDAGEAAETLAKMIRGNPLIQKRR